MKHTYTKVIAVAEELRSLLAEVGGLTSNLVVDEKEILFSFDVTYPDAIIALTSGRPPSAVTKAFGKDSEKFCIHSMMRGERVTGTIVFDLRGGAFADPINQEFMVCV